MSTIRIDADALFRAVTASNFKLLAYHLDLQSGEVLTRTMRPDEIADAPQGPSVMPLPKMGGDLTPKKDAAPFGPPPVSVKKKIFSDDDLPKQPAFDGGFWQRDEKRKADLFRDGGFRRESGTKKLAEIFGETAPKKKADPFAHGQPAARLPAPPAAAPAVDEATRPRIPIAGEQQQLEWVAAFARGFGDPEIRDQILAALKTAKPFVSLERVLRRHQRMSQQWELYFRKQALECAQAWLTTLNVEWELVEPENARP